jgi:hypothetical protein
MDFKGPQMGIPDAVRQAAERNVEQSRSAYTQFMNMAKQAQDMVAKSSGTMTETTLQIQNRPSMRKSKCRPTRSKRRNSAN